MGAHSGWEGREPAQHVCGTPQLTPTNTLCFCNLRSLKWGPQGIGEGWTVLCLGAEALGRGPGTRRRL